MDLRRAGRGEREAIQLAKEQGAFLLCDDRTAVNHARREGISVTGTLGILQAAHIKGWVQIEKTISDLRLGTEFRFPSEARLEEIVRLAHDLRDARLENQEEV